MGFYPLIDGGTYSITLCPGLEYEEFVKMVKERLAIGSKFMTIKLDYQVPPWMAIDDGDGSTLQFISDDHEEDSDDEERAECERLDFAM